MKKKLWSGRLIIGIVVFYFLRRKNLFPSQRRQQKQRRWSEGPIYLYRGNSTSIGMHCNDGAPSHHSNELYNCNEYTYGRTRKMSFSLPKYQLCNGYVIHTNGVVLGEFSDFLRPCIVHYSTLNLNISRAYHLQSLKK